MIALVTGASFGIGKDIAKELAKRGHSLVLVARSQGPLETFAQELRDAHPIEVHMIPLDLAESQGPARLFEITESKKLPISLLINNAGFGDHETFSKSSWVRQRDMIQLNITTLTELTHLYLPQMLQRKKGRILNVASTAGFQPGPYMSVYYASKAFVISFSEALSEELEGSGVTVTVLCPGVTSTEFQKRAQMKKNLLFYAFPAATSQGVARYGVESLLAGKRLAIHGWLNGFLVQCLRIAPRKLVLKVMRFLQARS